MTKGWTFKPFGTVCTLTKGRQPSLQDTNGHGTLPYLAVKYLRGEASPRFADPADKNSVHVGKREVLIICDGSNSGETFLGFEGILASTMAKISHTDDLDATFLRYYLSSTFSRFNDGMTGAAIPHLDLAALKRERLPFPPLPEQRRIVETLDKAMQNIAVAKASTEKNISGTLELFQSFLKKLLFAVGPDWKSTTLGEVCDLYQGLAINAKTKHLLVKHSSMPLLRIKDLRNGTSEQYVAGRIRRAVRLRLKI